MKVRLQPANSVDIIRFDYSNSKIIAGIFKILIFIKREQFIRGIILSYKIIFVVLLPIHPLIQFVEKGKDNINNIPIE